MSYTQTDLENIDQAILDFALGKRAGRVTIGSHTVEYAEVTIDQLQTLRGVVSADVLPSHNPRVYGRNGGRG